MAELLGKWVNQDIGLSTPITSFDHDFSNGYLLGELLYRLHLMSERDFVNGFKNDSHPHTLISNFASLSALLSPLHVKCDANLVRDIMQSRSGAALRLLYGIKMSVGKLQQKQQQQANVKGMKQAPLSPSTLSRTGPLGHTVQLPYDRLEQRRLAETLVKTAHLNQKQKQMAMHQAKFDQAASTQLQHQQESKQQADEARMSRIQQQQAYERQQIQQKRVAKQEWEEKHTEEWVRGQARMSDRLHSEAMFRTTQTQLQDMRITSQRHVETTTTHDKIDEFENNLERIGVERDGNTSTTGYTGVDGDDVTPQEHVASLSRTLPTQQEQHHTATHTLAAIHGKTISDAAAAKEREHRRRKVMVDQTRAAEAAEEERRKQALMEKVMRQSQQEKKLGEEIWRTRQLEQIIRANRSYRDEQDRLEKEAAHARILDRDRMIYAAMKQQHERELELEKQRYAELRAERELEQHVKREGECCSIVNQVVDLVYKTVQYRELSDQALVPPSMWRQWMQLFVTSRPLLPAPTTAPTPAIPPTDPAHMDVSDIDRAVSRHLIALLDGDDVTADVMDEHSFEMYLKGEEEWEYKEVVPVPMEESVTSRPPSSLSTRASSPTGGKPAISPTAATAAVKKTPTSAFKKQGVITTSELFTLPVETSNPIEVIPPENRVLGALIQKLVDVAAGKEIPPDLPEVPAFPLGVCVIGKSFSGRSTQVDLLATKFQLHVIRMNELITHALSASVDDEDEKKKGKKGTTSPAPLVRKKTKSIKTVQQQLGMKLKKLLSRGDVVTDDIYVALIVDAIKRLKEVNENRPEPGATSATAAGTATPAANETTDAKEQTDLAANGETKTDTTPTTSTYGGWIIDGFPETAVQARLLEKELTGFELPKAPKPGAPKITKTGADRRPSRLAQPPSPPARTGPYPSGLSLILRLQCPSDVCTRRALGRRIDPVTGKQYHLDVDEPDMDSTIKERLVSLSDQVDVESKLPEQCSAWEDQQAELETWYAHFDTLHDINGSLPLDDVKEACRQQVRCVVVAAEEKNNPDERQEEKKEEPTKETQVVPDDTQVISIPQDMTQPIFTSRDLVHFTGFYDIDAATYLANKWIHMEHAYTTRMSRLFREGRARERAQLEHYAATRKNFIRFLRRPDTKMNLVSVFQDRYNGLSPDLRLDVSTKEELHHRTDELADALWRITDQRRIDAEEEMDAIREDGWWENTSAAVVDHFVTMMQLELDRYQTSVRIAQDSITVMKGQVVLEECEPHVFTLPHFLTQKDLKRKPKKEVKKEVKREVKSRPSPTSTATTATAGAKKQTEKKQAPVKKEKKGDVVEPDVLAEMLQAAKEGILSPDAALAELSGDDTRKRGVKKSDKKSTSSVVIKTATPAVPATPTRQGSAGKIRSPLSGLQSKRGSLVVNKKPGTAATAGQPTLDPIKFASDALSDAQLRAIVDTENRILWARLLRIYSYGTSLLTELRSYHNTFISRLDHWIGLRIKGESAAIDVLSVAIKHAIEKEQPLKQQLRLDGEDCYVDRDLIAQPDVGMPSSSPFSDRFDASLANRLTPAQLCHLHHEIRLHSHDGLIATADLLSLLQRISATSSRVDPVETMPRAWSHATPQFFQSLVSAFDPLMTGHVDIYTFLISTALPTELSGPSISQLQSMLRAMCHVDTDEDGCLTWEQWSRVAWWWEGTRGEQHVTWEAIKRFAFQLFSSELPASSTETPASTTVVPYLDLLTCLCFDDDTTTGLEKLRILVQQYTAAWDGQNITSYVQHITQERWETTTRFVRQNMFGMIE